MCLLAVKYTLSVLEMEKKSEMLQEHSTIIILIIIAVHYLYIMGKTWNAACTEQYNYTKYLAVCSAGVTGWTIPVRL